MFLECSGHSCTHRSAVLGILFWLLLGKRPFAGHLSRFRSRAQIREVGGVHSERLRAQTATASRLEFTKQESI